MNTSVSVILRFQHRTVVPGQPSLTINSVFIDSLEHKTCSRIVEWFGVMVPTVPM